MFFIIAWCERYNSDVHSRQNEYANWIAVGEKLSELVLKTVQTWIIVLIKRFHLRFLTSLPFLLT